SSDVCSSDLTKKAALIERPSFGRPDSANPSVRSALLSEVVSANVKQRIPAQEIVGCSGGDTGKKNTQAILRCSEKSTKLASSARSEERRVGKAQNALGGLAGRPRPRRPRWCNGKPST